MKNFVFTLAAALLLAPAAADAVGPEGPERISIYAEPQNPAAVRMLDYIRSFNTSSADEQYVTRLLTTKAQPVTLAELCEYNRVRSIQMSEYGVSPFEYLPCTFYFEGSQLCFRITGGPQRKAGLLSQSKDDEITFNGWRFFGGDEEVNDEKHKDSGKIYKLSSNKIIMMMDADSPEILEFTRPDAPTGLTIEDSKGYVYSFYYEAGASESLAVDAGGRYSGDVVIPEALQVDDELMPVTTVRRGAMWKKDGADNIGEITSVSLPSSVQLIGGDAFRGNGSLKEFSCDKRARVENRAFFDCPELKLNPVLPSLAYTDPRQETKLLEGVILPLEQADGGQDGYTWAFFKERHTSLGFGRWLGQDDENAMACWCSDVNRVKGAEFKFLNTALVEDLFRGYTKNYGHDVVLADNYYVGSHDFPAFSRWIFGERKKSMPSAFAEAQAAKYGRTVAYCCEAGKVNSTGDQLCITEFKPKDKEARIVLSWVRDGQEVCSYTKTTELDEEGQEYSVWNVDDEGSYGIPHILTVAYDEDGNVDLFLMHSAPESRTFLHLRQNGDILEAVQEYSLYVMYD